MKKCKQLIPILLIFVALLPQLLSGQNTYRDRELQPEKLMDTIGVKPGLIIGAGGDVFRKRQHLHFSVEEIEEGF